MAGGVLAFLGYACSSLWPPCPTLFPQRQVREPQEISQSLALHRVGETRSLNHHLCVLCQRCPAVFGLRMQNLVPRGGSSPRPQMQGCVPQEASQQLRVGQGVTLRGCQCGRWLCCCQSWGRAKLAPFLKSSWERRKEMVRPCMRRDVCGGKNIPLAQKIAAESGLK